MSTEMEQRSEQRAAAKIEKRRALLDRVGVTMAEGEDIKRPTVSVTEGQLLDLMLAGESVSVKNATTAPEDRLFGAVEAITAAASKLEAFAGSTAPLEHHYNDKVQVYTPGMVLMLFNRVMLLQDACSDSLQHELDNGWRIVAACPQPDQRRPDYIMGRYDPSHVDASGSGHNALRG